MLDEMLTEWTHVPWVDDLVYLAITVVAALVLFWVVGRVLKITVHRFVRSTRAGWDDILVERRVFTRAALLAPAMVVQAAAGWFPEFAGAVDLGVDLFLIFVGLLIADSLLSASADIYERHPMASRRPIRGMVQLFKLFLVIMGLVAAAALLLGTSPWGILSGIGAMTAVIMLVFRDTLLSVAAGVQMAAYDLLRVGDWLEMPTFGADGDVIDISLNTVRVRNFDKTIVSVPTHKFLDNSFKNWRGMSEAGGRRIKRALVLDQTSVKFTDEALMRRFESIELIADYVRTKKKEIEAANRNSGVNTDMPVNGRRLTNIGCFRAYAYNYLLSRPDIHQDMTLIVRQSAPTSEGLPLEIYAFTTDTAWAAYEETQSSIFDHLLAVLPWFELGVYQRNSREDSRLGRVDAALPHGGVS